MAMSKTYRFIFPRGHKAVIGGNKQDLEEYIVSTTKNCNLIRDSMKNEGSNRVIDIRCQNEQSELVFKLAFSDLYDFFKEI